MIKVRLRYYASRLKKYDATVNDDIHRLLQTLSGCEKDGILEIDEEKAKELKILTERIRTKIDDLWFGKSWIFKIFHKLTI